MTRRLPWYKRDPQAWFNGTRDLTLEEKGAYNELLELMYLRDRPIPDDSRFVANFLNISQRRWQRIRQALLDCERLTLRGDYISDERFERERGQFEQFRSQAVTWGHKGGKIRAETAARNRQGQFDLNETSRVKKLGFPPREAKATHGEPAEMRDYGDGEEKTVENQGSEPRASLDDFDDSFLRENALERPSKQHLNAQASDHSESKNGSFPPSQSKPARVARASARTEEYLGNRGSNVRDSSAKVRGSGGKAKPRKKAKAARQMPQSWEPEPLTQDVAEMVENWPDGMLQTQIASFRDHASANGRTLKDWDAGLRNWLRKANNDRQPKHRGAARSGWASVADRTVRQGHN